MEEQQLRAVLNGLKNAMRSEFEGYHFYLMAAENTSDDKGQKMFRQLAADEFDHLNFLLAQFDSLTETQQINDSLSLKRIAPVTEKNPIFSDVIKNRIKEAHYEMTALSVGIQLELNAVKAYKSMAASADVATVAKFYEDLAEWENSHYTLLLTQQDALKEDYWTANHFAPF